MSKRESMTSGNRPTPKRKTQPMTTFEEALTAAKAAPPRTTDVSVDLNDTSYRFRVTAMRGMDYATETLRHPPRMEVPVDRQYGYNIAALTFAVLPKCAKRIEGDDEIDLTPEDWERLLAVLDGGSQQAFVNAVYALNEAPSARLATAALGVFNK